MIDKNNMNNINTITRKNAPGTFQVHFAYKHLIVTILTETEHSYQRFRKGNQDTPKQTSV